MHRNIKFPEFPHTTSIMYMQQVSTIDHNKTCKINYNLTHEGLPTQHQMTFIYSNCFCVSTSSYDSEVRDVSLQLFAKRKEI